MGQVVGYQSFAVMPQNSPVRTAQGQVQQGKALAQASASLEACRQLHQVQIMFYCTVQSVSQSANQSVSQSISQWVGQSTLTVLGT